MTGILSGQEIRALINAQPPLVESWQNLAEQVQPNGFDLTLRDVAMMETGGEIAVKSRQIPPQTPLAYDAFGYIDLVPGAYLITYNEIVHLPKDIMALGAPRSSLLRCGVTLGMAVWDAGYNGRSQSLLVVYHPHGFRVQQNARIGQLVFFRLASETEGYSGIYQGENIK
ncbi:MAG: deoxyuridine 5'-triphosphate nucleotidohydrolase [Dehalococcoidales bacterium]|nr:deoxyuridine 5'-triphosphate nucleotidohydrolase [Dehalococcoidales bacterium]